MVNYELGKIYKLVCNETGMTYFGSTAQSTLSKRLGQHKSTYEGYKKGMKVSCTSFKILENGNYEIILVEDYPCERKEQLIARERWYIENNECCNKEVPGRTDKEYREENKEKLAEWHKKYWEENKEKLAEINKKWREENKEKLAEKGKKWREENKEKLAEKNKKYWEENKEKLAEKKNEKIRCECCDCEVSRGSWLRHTKSKKHQANSK
jgi:hypothetical protein